MKALYSLRNNLAMTRSRAPPVGHSLTISETTLVLPSNDERAQIMMTERSLHLVNQMRHEQKALKTVALRLTNEQKLYPLIQHRFVSIVNRRRQLPAFCDPVCNRDTVRAVVCERMRPARVLDASALTPQQCWLVMIVASRTISSTLSVVAQMQ